MCQSRQFLPRLLRRARLPGDFPSGRPISERDQSVVQTTGFSLAGNVPRNGTEWAARAWQRGERRLPGPRPLMGTLLTVQSPCRSPGRSRGTPVVGRTTTSRRDPNELAGVAWLGMAKSGHRFAARKPPNRQFPFPPNASRLRTAFGRELSHSRIRQEPAAALQALARAFNPGASGSSSGTPSTALAASSNLPCAASATPFMRRA